MLIYIYYFLNMTSYTIDKYYVETCSICLSDIYNDDILFTTDCNHSFHTSCILPWFANNHSCPICRQEIIFDHNFFENLTDIVVDNIVDNVVDNVVGNVEELHEDLAYYLLLRDILVIVNDLDCLNNIRNSNTYLYTQLNPLLIYRGILDYIYTNVLLLISYIRNINLDYLNFNNNISIIARMDVRMNANNSDIDPYYNLPYY